MINGKKVLAIIPARGGSKRLPRKNVLPLAGKPLIGWTIEAAHQSNYIDEILVSTDCKEIAESAELFGVTVAELRPPYLSTDEASTLSVLKYELSKTDAEIVIVLQPTSPLRLAEDIDGALELYCENKARIVVSVCECEHPPMWSNTLPDNASLNGFIKTSNLKRSQALPKHYRLNGAVYIYDKSVIMNDAIGFCENSFAYIMNQNSSVDIDTELDFKFADYLLREGI